jgi:dimethylargininase
MYADCCFVEDNAIVVKDKAIINFLGAESRRKEVSGVEKALKEACVLYKYSNFLPSDAKSCFI